MIDIASLPIVRAQLEAHAAEANDPQSDTEPPTPATVNIADNPVVRAQLEQHAAAQVADVCSARPAYARAPVATGPQQTGARPAAISRTTR